MLETPSPKNEGFKRGAISRRKFLKGAAFLGASIIGGELGDRVPIPENSEIIEFDKEKSEEILRKLFRVERAYADPRLGGVNHDITPVVDPASTVLSGEIHMSMLNLMPGIKSIEDIAGMYPTGAEILTTESLNKLREITMQYAIIIATDSHGLSANDVINRLKIIFKSDPEALRRLLGNFPALGIASLQQIRPERNPNDSEQMVGNIQISRRDFGELVLKSLAGFSLGGVSRHLINRVMGNETKSELNLRTEGADRVTSALENIYNPYENYMITARDCIMHLNMANSSRLNFPVEVTGIHDSVAPGHIDKFNYLIKDRNPELIAREYLTKIIDDTLTVIETNKDYFAPPIDPEEVSIPIIRAAVNLVRVHSLYGPALIRINKNLTQTSISGLNLIENRDKLTSAPFEIWCQTMKEFDDMVTDPDIRHIFSLSINIHRFMLDAYSHISDDIEKTIAWPGDPARVDGEYVFFGYKATLANGFPVSLEEID